MAKLFLLSLRQFYEETLRRMWKCGNVEIFFHYFLNLIKTNKKNERFKPKCSVPTLISLVV